MSTSGFHIYGGNIQPEVENRDPDLSDGSINIWQIDIQSLLPVTSRLQKMLSSAELTRAARFHQKKDAQQFMITRAALRILLADTLSEHASDIDIVLSAHNKPILAQYANVHFNVSHSENFALIAISRQHVGIDIECIKSEFDYQSIADYAFSAAESAQLAASKHPVIDFYRIWTRKEAFLKGLGSGLTNDLKLISCLDGKNILPAHIPGFDRDWKISSIELNPGYMMSIAAERREVPNQIFLFDFSQAAL